MELVLGNAALVQAEEWSAAHPEAEALWHTLAQVGLWGLVLAFLVLVVRAILHLPRYRAVSTLRQGDLHALHMEVSSAEQDTVGEIVPVIVERADAHPQADWLAALTTLVLGTALLAGYLPWEHPSLLMLCQLALGGVGFATARLLPGFKRLFLSEARATEMAEEQAVQEFYNLRLHRTQYATGVLVFVSLLEHRVVVMGDEGIAAKVDEGLWRQVDEAVLKGIRSGSLRDGLVEGIRIAARVLAEHFPFRDGDRNEIPDRVIVRRQ